MSNPNLIEATKPHRWKAGQSGNPKGRPPRRSLIEILKAELAKKDGPNGETNGEVLIHRMVQHAIHGDFRFAQLVMEYSEGKPEQPIRMIEEQVRQIAEAEGLDYNVVRLRMRDMAERLA